MIGLGILGLLFIVLPREILGGLFGPLFRFTAQYMEISEYQTIYLAVIIIIALAVVMDAVKNRNQ